MKRITILLFLTLVVVLLAACQSNQPQPPATDMPTAEPAAAEPTTEPATAVPTVEPTAEEAAASPTAEVADPGALTEHAWQWVSFTDPLEQFDVEAPERYLLTFNEDGTVNIVADCNNASGSYMDDNGSLTIELGPMTLAACPPDSHSDQFVTLLGGAARYFFEDGQLFIDLMADGGTMAFAPASAEATADAAMRDSQAPSGIAVEQLKNATYSGIYDDPVTLTDGLWEDDPFTVEYLEGSEVYGDLDADGVQDAIVLLLERGGGTANIIYIAAQLNQDGQPVDAGAVRMDEVQIRSATIEDDQVVTELVVRGPGDGDCCPTHKASRTYALQGGQLAEVAAEDEDLEQISAADLNGTSWILLELSDGQPALDDVEVTISFQDGQISGSGGCNNYNTSFSLGEDNPFVMTIDPVVSTKMACPEPILDQETAYFTALEDVSQWSYEFGHLALWYLDDQDMPARLLFDPQAAGSSQAEGLTGQTWQWVSFTDPLEAYEVESPGSYTLSFNEDGTVNIVADCNNAIGSYTDDDGSLSIEVGPMTQAACPPESRSDEFVQHLGFAARYFFEEGFLYIDLFADGGTMAFAPAQEPGYAGDITSYPWLWTSFTSPVEHFEVEAPENYVVTFNDDALGASATVSIKADCNNANGSYTVDAGSLEIEIGPMTLAACPPESRSDQFVTLLGSAARYFFEDAQLYIDLAADGGTMVFAPEGEARMGGTGQLPDELVAQLDAWLNGQVYSEGGNPGTAAPGLVLLVETPEGRYLKAAGVSSLEEGTLMQVDDRLEIGSNTKSFTVVLLMQLQEEGVLSLDDKLSEWLPELAEEIPNGDEVTLYQLANHISGIPDYTALIGGGLNDPEMLVQGYTPEELVQYAIDNAEAEFTPGESWSYNNTGYILLGLVAETATGKSLGELYQERIFDPLGLQTAILIEGVPQEGGLDSQGYYQRSSDGEVANSTQWNASQGWASGAIAMTAEDLATYAKALAAGELLQNPDSLAQMLTFNEDAEGVLAAYGLGLLDMGDGYWGHEGATPGFQSMWGINPDEGTLVVGMSNSYAYSAGNLLNAINIIEGRGAQPFYDAIFYQAGEVHPEILVAMWQWTQMTDGSTGSSAETDIDPGTILILRRDGVATLQSATCGPVEGTFTATAPDAITFGLDASAVSCPAGDPLEELLGMLDVIASWRFENGGVVFVLDDGTELTFRPPY